MIATELKFDPATRAVYAHLEPIVDLLLQGGNQFARANIDGERTGRGISASFKNPSTLI